KRLLLLKLLVLLIWFALVCFLIDFAQFLAELGDQLLLRSLPFPLVKKVFSIWRFTKCKFSKIYTTTDGSSDGANSRGSSRSGSSRSGSNRSSSNGSGSANSR